MVSEQAYYLSLEAEGNNVCRSDRSLVINCTGMCVLPRFFESHTELGREDYYLQYLVKGEMRVWSEGGQQIMKPGQAVLYYPHTAYHYAMHGSEEVQYYWVHFTGADADSLVETCNIKNSSILSIGSSASVVSGFRGLFHDFILRDRCFYISAASGLTAIFTELSRRLESGETGCAAATERIYRALTHIHQNFEKGITVQLLAELEHLSGSRFRSLFRQATGLSPMNYLTVLRLNQSQQLMLQTNSSICEIAQAVGFNDQLYFSRIFKKHTGISPSLYRQRLMTVQAPSSFSQGGV